MTDGAASSSEKDFDRSALYYPNVHIRNYEWLKATLLCFPSLERMVPGDFDYKQADAAIPKFFSSQVGRGDRPMLGIRKLDDEFTSPERTVLLDRIMEDVEENRLIDRFSAAATRTQFGENSDDFQIHEYKVKGKFLEYLTKVELAWSPAKPLNDHDKWFAVHPLIGQTILSTNAVALAKRHDLEIVTDTGAVHSALLGANAGDVYDIMIRNAAPPAREETEKVNDLFRFIIVTEFDLSDLSLEEIVDFNKTGQGLKALKTQLLKHVNGLGGVPDQEIWNGWLRKKTGETVMEWAEQDTFMAKLRRTGNPNLSGDLKDFIKTVASGLTAGAAVATAVGSALPGLAVSAVFAAAPLWSRWRNDRTPYQFLSMLERTSGVRRRHVLSS